jgi:hypothetical protein
VDIPYDGVRLPSYYFRVVFLTGLYIGIEHLPESLELSETDLDKKCCVFLLGIATILFERHYVIVYPA